MSKPSERLYQKLLFGWRNGSSRLMVPNYTPLHWYENDLWRVTNSGYVEEFEIKLTKADFKKDHKKAASVASWDANSDRRTKHQRLFAGDSHGPNRFFFVIPGSLEDELEIPDFAGLIVIPHTRARPIVRKAAPRLHTEKVSEDELKKANAALYWRYWRQRKV